METGKFILVCLIAIGTTIPVTAQNKSEKKAHIERTVKNAIDSKDYRISVNQMHPMRGNSRTLTSDYFLKIRNDSVFSYLPYFGVAYSVPYGGGKGLIFNVPVNDYKTERLKKDKVRITFKASNEEDRYQYTLTIFSNGSSTINIQPTNKQSISFTGDMDIE